MQTDNRLLGDEVTDFEGGVTASISKQGLSGEQSGVQKFVSKHNLVSTVTTVTSLFFIKGGMVYIEEFGNYGVHGNTGNGGSITPAHLKFLRDNNPIVQAARNAR